MSVETHGRLFHEGILEKAAEETLRRWLPEYLAEACAQFEHGPIVAPKSWTTASDQDRFPEKGLPALIIASPGTIDDPERKADRYSADYELEVAITIAAATGGAARLMGQIYGAAILGVLTTQPKLAEGLAVEDWTGTNNGTVSTEQRRTQVALSHTFAVHCDHAVSVMAGPLEPAGPDELPEITGVEVDVVPYDPED